MRAASRRFAELVKGWNQWETRILWGNSGGYENEASLIAGSVTASSLSQIRWSCDLTLADVPMGLDGINPYSTQMRVWHGIAGEPLLPMGVYRVTKATRADEGRLQVSGASFESYLLSPFDRPRSFPRQSASLLARTLIQEVLPSAALTWGCEDPEMPRITAALERWPLIDGNRDAKSVAKAVGGRIYTTGAGTWEANPTPSLADPPVWTADEGDDGVLISADEELTSDGVFNILIASGQSTDTGFRAGRAEDLDPMSPTYVGRPVEAGGFGPQVKQYTSALITSTAQAQTAARAQLASSLGLRQKITYTQLHDPRRDPGDVGIVKCVDGYRRAIDDALTWDLLGGPMQSQTRTTATSLDGVATDITDE